MLFLIGSTLTLSLIAFLFLWYGRRKHSDGFRGLSIFTTIVVIIYVCIIIITNMSGYGAYKNDLAKLQTIKAKQEIQLNRTSNVITALQNEVSKYLKHEKETYKAISPAEISILLIKYPELQSVKTINVLMEQISTLNSGYYDLLNQEQDILTEIIYYQTNTLYVFATK